MLSLCDFNTNVDIGNPQVLLSIAAPSQVMLTTIYWVGFCYSMLIGTTEYASIMTHGGCLILVMIDGFLLSRIPLRVKQVIFFQAFMLMYIIWSVIHAYSGIGNPYDDGMYLYELLQWKNYPVSSLMLSLTGVFLVSPIVYLLLRAVSRSTPKRLLDEMKEKEQSQDFADEETEAC